MKGEINRAIRDYDELIKLKPDNANAYNLRGSAYRLTRSFNRAYADLDQATKLDPNFVDAYVNLGLTYSDEKQLDSAVHEFDTAIKLGAKDPFVFNSRSILLRTLGSRDRAFEDFN